MVAVANLANLAPLEIGWRDSERWQAVPIIDTRNFGDLPVAWNVKNLLSAWNKPAMTDEEILRKRGLEAVVDRGLLAETAVLDAGTALSELKTSDYWRDSHDSWQLYVKERFKMTARRAQQLMEFSAISEVVKREIGTSGSVFEMSERSARPISTIPAAERAEVVAEIVEKSGGKQPKNSTIRAVVASRKRKAKVGKPKVEKPRRWHVAGCKFQGVPTHASPIFRGWRESVVALLAKIDAEEAGQNERAA